MKSEFSIEADTERSLIRIKMVGFFTAQDIDRFLDARGVAHDLLKCALNAHVTLNDIRGMTGQPHTTIDAFQKVLSDPKCRSRRLAFVVGSTLARAHLMRALGDRDAKCFNDPIAAEAWLLSDNQELELPRSAAG